MQANPLHARVLHARRKIAARARGKDDDDDPIVLPPNLLEQTIKMKSKQVEAQLLEYGQEALEERLQGSLQVPANPHHP
jgi:hypothetical protein